MNEARIEQMVEHKLLVEWFYSHNFKFRDILQKENPDDIAKIFTSAAKKYYDESVYYDGEDFDLYEVKINDRGIAFVLELPKPAIIHNCSFIVFYYDDANEIRRYFTVEEAYDDSNYILGGYSRELKHFNFGPVDNDSDAVIAKIQEIVK